MLFLIWLINPPTGEVNGGNIMNDTQCGSFPDLVCSDCGEKGCSFKHWGHLVLRGKFGKFCHFCFEQRQEWVKKGGVPLPFGVQPPGVPEEFANRALRVITENKTVYYLGLTKKKDERIIVSQNGKKFPYIRSRVMRLKIGERFVFRIFEDHDCGLFYTFPVARIELC